MYRVICEETTYALEYQLNVLESTHQVKSIQFSMNATDDNMFFSALVEIGGKKTLPLPIVVEMGDDFECSCGNMSHTYGFYPCDEEGENVEPDHDWTGHYICGNCGLIYLPKKESE